MAKIGRKMAFWGDFTYKIGEKTVFLDDYTYKMGENRQKNGVFGRFYI
jgi:hypothetical protein